MKFKRLFALLLLAMGLIVANAAEAVGAVGPTGKKGPTGDKGLRGDKGATGATFSGLPTGVNGAWLSNVITISGTLSVSGTFNYTAELTGGCGSVASSGTITVNPIVSVRSSISGNSNIIAGTTVTYSITSDPNATTYQWDYRESTSASWVTNVSSTSSVNILWPTTTSDGEVRVTITNSCNSESRTLSIIAAGVLPVELLYFEGTKYPKYNLLKWSTASENNSDYFSIEVSTDGFSWKKIGEAKAAGNSNTKMDYSYVHSFNDPNVHYYKLLQYDYDGKFKEYGPIGMNNTLKPSKLLKIINLMGQEIGENYKGIVIEVYEDGTIIRTLR